MKNPLLLLTLGAAFLAAPAQAGGERVVAIAPVQIGSVDADRASQISRALRAATEKLIPTQSTSDTATHVDAARALGIECTGNDRVCWRNIRDITTADELILANLSSSPEGIRLGLDLIRAAANLDRTLEITLKGPLTDDNATRVITQLLALPAELVIISDVKSEVEINGKLVGIGPRNVVEVAPGKHTVVVRADGKEQSREVQCDAGTRIEITIHVHDGGVPAGLWGGLSVATLGGVLAAGGGIVLALGVITDPVSVNAANPSATYEAWENSQSLQVIGGSVLATGAVVLVGGAAWAGLSMGE